MSNKLILGTVQFGLDYGINNRTGRPEKKKFLRYLIMPMLVESKPWIPQMHMERHWKLFRPIMLAAKIDFR